MNSPEPKPRHRVTLGPLGHVLAKCTAVTVILFFVWLSVMLLKGVIDTVNSIN